MNLKSIPVTARQGYRNARRGMNHHRVHECPEFDRGRRTLWKQDEERLLVLTTAFRDAGHMPRRWIWHRMDEALEEQIYRLRQHIASILTEQKHQLVRIVPTSANSAKGWVMPWWRSWR